MSRPDKPFVYRFLTVRSKSPAWTWRCGESAHLRMGGNGWHVGCETWEQAMAELEKHLRHFHQPPPPSMFAGRSEFFR